MSGNPNPKQTGPEDRSASGLPIIRPHSAIKVLFVDDEVGFVDVLTKRMAKRKLNVTKSYNGAEAFRALKKSDFDVVILDLKMQDMDGIEVLKIIRKMDPDLDVIMLTGHGSEKAARDGIKYGAVDYLTKPCDFDELINKIEEVYRKKRC